MRSVDSPFNPLEVFYQIMLHTSTQWRNYELGAPRHNNYTALGPIPSNSLVNMVVFNGL